MVKKAVLLIIFLILFFMLQNGFASVNFDGKTWYDSHSPSTMSINSEGQLKWIPYNDHQIITRLPSQRLSVIGDVAEISYLWLSDGQGNIAGCEDCQNEATCQFNKDITCVSGTGDFRVGLFESDGDYITADGMGLTNEIFRGYKGYKFCMQPHVPETPVRWQEASGEPHIAGGFYERDMVDDPRLMTVNEVFDRISMFGGYDLPLNTWSLWTIRLERLSSTSIKMSMTLNGLTYTDIDTTDSASIPQPQKIDVFAIDFANPNPYTKVVFDIPCEPNPLDFDENGTVDENDLNTICGDWLKKGMYISMGVEPNDSNLIMDYSFDGILNNPVPTGLTDETGSYTAVIIPGTDPNSAIKYSSPNPITGSGTSAEFINSNWGTGAADTFVIPDSGGLDFSAFDEFTIEMFVNPASSASSQTRRLFSESIYAYMYLTYDNILHAIRKWGPGSWNENYTHLQSADFPHDTWSHVAMTWDTDSTEDKFRLYINGELADSAPGSSAPTINSAAGFTIGGYQRDSLTTGQPFSGSIDQFHIYSYALSQDEIVYLANNGPSVVFYPLDSQVDLNNDDIIDFRDYAEFASQWLNSCQ